MAKITVEQHNEKAVFVGVIKQGDDERQIMEYLDELEFLAETAGATGVKKFIQKVDRPDSRTYIRSGKLQEIREYCEENEIEVVSYCDCTLGCRVYCCWSSGRACDAELWFCAVGYLCYDCSGYGNSERMVCRRS